MAANEIDLITYFDSKFNALKEYFDERFRSMDEKFSCEKDSNKEEINDIHSLLKNHDQRIGNLEKTEGNKARNLLQSIKDNTVKFIVPTIIILLAFLLGSGTLQKIIGLINE